MALLQEILVPLLAVNDTTLTVAELSFAAGSKVRKGDVVMVLETSKTTYDVEAESDGFIQYMCEAGSDYDVNTPIARIYSEEGEIAAAPITPVVTPITTTTATRTRTTTTIVARPAVRPTQTWEGDTIFSREALRLMAEAGLDRSAFAGWDMVTGADIKTMTGAPAPAKTPAKEKAPAPQASDPRVTVKRLSSAKKREIEYLSDVQAPGLTSTIDTYIDTEGIFTHINKGLRYLKDSLLPIIIYESSRLLADYPLLNGYYTADGAATYKEVNPGFAIDIDKGLKVLKVAQAGEKSIADIEAEILRLSGAYLDDALAVEDLTDITFTITDLSSEGVAFFRPLINKMNSAILGVSAIDPKLQRCTLSLTFDHRMTEGKEVARFLQELKERLESYRPKDASARQDVACFKCQKTLKEDLGGAGLVRCVTPEGKDGYICQSCLKGF
ncbi:MAG: 2-oxo acid dehydrogenase subunit E2 [Bacteroidetes bacterium]|nr:2-oxo acid dehydrogenase subunit E2 [Bacteroidota bacterium]